VSGVGRLASPSSIESSLPSAWTYPQDCCIRFVSFRSRLYCKTLRTKYDDSNETLDRLRKLGAQVLGEVVQYQGSYRLCYIRGAERLLLGLAQELN
jgi:hypothetical protein